MRNRCDVSLSVTCPLSTFACQCSRHQVHRCFWKRIVNYIERCAKHRDEQIFLPGCLIVSVESFAKLLRTGRYLVSLSGRAFEVIRGDNCSCSVRSRKLANQETNPLPVFVEGSIEQSLRTIFGEIGGHATVDLLKYDESRRRAILRVPEDFYVKLRAALTLTSTFQGVLCHFYVHSVSRVLLSLLDTHF